jgi:hypothetical protein
MYQLYLKAAAEALGNVRSINQIPALRPFLPYVLHPIDERQPYGGFIWLNRAYKPLGTSTLERVDYAHFPHLHVTTPQRDAIVKGLVSHADFDDCQILKGIGAAWIYEDHCCPRLSMRFVRRLKSVIEACL